MFKQWKKLCLSIHSDSRDKLLSVVIYIATSRMKVQRMKTSQVRIKNKLNGFLIVHLFLVETIIHWHSYKADGKIIDLH